MYPFSRCAWRTSDTLIVIYVKHDGLEAQTLLLNGYATGGWTLDNPKQEKLSTGRSQNKKRLKILKESISYLLNIYS